MGGSFPPICCVDENLMLPFVAVALMLGHTKL